jgi:hypothetical protein
MRSFYLFFSAFQFLFSSTASQVIGLGTHKMAVYRDVLYLYGGETSMATNHSVSRINLIEAQKGNIRMEQVSSVILLDPGSCAFDAAGSSPRVVCLQHDPISSKIQIIDINTGSETIINVQPIIPSSVSIDRQFSFLS